MSKDKITGEKTYNLEVRFINKDKSNCFKYPHRIKFYENDFCSVDIIMADNWFKHKDIDKYITDLEAKLAESEKKFNVVNNLRKNSDEVLLNYKTEKYGLDKTIQELRKMKLSLPEKEWYYKGFENCERQMSSHIADLTLEVKQLKQQLAEKDEEIKQLKEQRHIYLNRSVDECNKITMLELELQHKNQAKISFAVEQLEKVKEILNKSDESGYIIQFRSMNDRLMFYKELDNQIKQLKEGK